MSTTKLVGGQRNSRAFMDARMDTHDDRLDTVETQSSAATTNVTALQIAAKWLYAATKPTVHMESDLEGLVGLASLTGGALQADANARANALKVAWNAHLAGVGTVTVNGEHKAIDAANVVATADASDVDTCEALVLALLASIIAHGNQSGVHFTSDTGAGGTAAALTVPDPEILADLITDLNDLKTAMTTHMALAAAVLPP